MVTAMSQSLNLRRQQKKINALTKEGKAPEPKRKPQKVEQVFDDCGEDLSGLDACLAVESDSDEDEKKLFNNIESFST